MTIQVRNPYTGEVDYPTVLTEVNHNMLVMTEESFAPIMPVMRCQTDDEAIALANDTYYGLSASVIAGPPRKRPQGSPSGSAPARSPCRTRS